jgi:cell division protein FtsN
MMILLALFSFVTSYFIFYKLTSKVDTKPLKTAKSIIVKATPEETDPGKTIVIGEGQGSPSPDLTVTPEPTESQQTALAVTPSAALNSASPVATTSPASTTAPAPTVKPTVKATPVPTPVRTPTPVPTAPKPKQAAFKVRVGAFDSKTEADKKAKELENMGYDTTVIDEPEGAYVQLGSFKEQEKALALAEEISQKGYSVIIRQLDE